MKYTDKDLQNELNHWKHYVKIGIKDYFRCVWHDWLLKHINRFSECRVMVASYKGADRKKINWVVKDSAWKKGGIKYYIQNAKSIYERKLVCYEFCKKHGGC